MGGGGEGWEGKEMWWPAINRGSLDWKAYLIPSMCPGLLKPYFNSYLTWICIYENAQIHDSSSGCFRVVAVVLRFECGLVSEIFSYSSVLAVGTSHVCLWANLFIFMVWYSCLIGWLGLKTLWRFLVDAVLENLWYITHGMSNLLYFQILVDALLNLFALWNMEKLWT